MNTKFLVFADLHVDIMHDGVARMQVILEEAKKEGVDYLIELGDFMYPDTPYLREHDTVTEKTGWFRNERDDEKSAIRKMIGESGLKLYCVLGNHDMDACGKELACDYFGLPAPQYTFDEGGIRFIALDTNYSVVDGALVPFDHCNYSKFKSSDWLGKEQLTWLREEIMKSSLPCVLLSHAPLGDEKLNAPDGFEVWRIVKDCNADRRRVILALNGHNHIDGVAVRSGVPFMSVNSASNIWIGHEFDCVRYSEQISKFYRHMTGCAPYWDALFAVISIDEGGIHVKGRQSTFVGPTPYELGFKPERFYHKIRPAVRDRELPLTPMDAEGLIDYED